MYIQYITLHKYIHPFIHPSIHPSIHAYQYIPFHSIPFHSISFKSFHSLHSIALHHNISIYNTPKHLWVINHFRQHPSSLGERGLSQQISAVWVLRQSGYEIQRCCLNEASDIKFINLYYNILQLPAILVLLHQGTRVN